MLKRQILFVNENGKLASGRSVAYIKKFYIHGSVHRNSILIRSNKMEQYAGFYLLQITVHVSGVYRNHHLEYIKL